MLSNLRFVSLLLFCLFLSPFVHAGENDRLGNWPQWRGPLATGMAPEGDPPTKWDEKTNVRWKTGFLPDVLVTPIVWGDQVFVLTAIDFVAATDPKDIPTPTATHFEKKTKPPGDPVTFIRCA